MVSGNKLCLAFSGNWQLASFRLTFLGRQITENLLISHITSLCYLAYAKYNYQTCVMELVSPTRMCKYKTMFIYCASQNVKIWLNKTLYYQRYKNTFRGNYYFCRTRQKWATIIIMIYSNI